MRQLAERLSLLGALVYLRSENLAAERARPLIPSPHSFSALNIAIVKRRYTTVGNVEKTSNVTFEEEFQQRSWRFV